MACCCGCTIWMLLACFCRDARPPRTMVNACDLVAKCPSSVFHSHGVSCKQMAAVAA